MAKHLIKSMHTPHGVIGWLHTGKDSQYCDSGEAVTIEWQPDANWGLEAAYYIDANGNVVNIDLTAKTFVMPDADITIGGIFKRFVLPDWTGSRDKSENVLDWLTAGDITPKSDAPIETSGQFTAQTTGGDMDIKNGTAQIVSIKGNLVADEDDVMQPFTADDFVSTGMNLVDPSAVLTIGGKKAYYFPVVAGVWGAYGTTQENNGYVIVGGDVDNVYFRAMKPTANNYGSMCARRTYNGTTYYLPLDGWMTIVCNDDEVPACHITWSNKYDFVAGEFANYVHSIAAQIAAVHDWGLGGIVTAARSVFDELNYSEMVGYLRIDRADLGTLGWAVATVVADEETTYIYTVTLSAMAFGGLAVVDQDAVSVQGNVLTVISTDISTVAAMKSYLSGVYIYYELATPATVTLTGWDGSFVANDYGLTYFLIDGELVDVAAYVAAEYQQGGKDQLFNAVSYQKIMAEVVATALCEINERLTAIEQRRDIVCTNLVVTRQATLPE